MDDDSAAFAFIDESYSVPGKFVSKTFYILGVAVVPASELHAVRAEVVLAAQTDFMHSAELMKTSAGQKYLKTLMSSISASVVLHVFIYEPLMRGDRLGEGTRAALFRIATAHLVEQFGLGLEITFEQRSPGAQQQADSRLASELREKYGLASIRPRSPADERMLCVPDLLATAIRQDILWGNSTYLNSFEAQPHVGWFTEQPT